MQTFDKQRKTLGEPTADVLDGPQALEFRNNAVNSVSSLQTLQPRKLLLAAREDGLVREENENRVVSRDDTTELTEVEDVKHFGDFSDKVSHFSMHFKPRRQ